MATSNNGDEYRVYFIVAVLMIIGLVWFIADERNSDESYAPCSSSYVAEYGEQDCREYQTSQQFEEDYKDCGFKPTC